MSNIMARVCEKCGRGTIVGVSRSHSNIATKRRLYLNLQTKKINGQRIKICTRCLKTLAKKQSAFKSIQATASAA